MCPMFAEDGLETTEHVMTTKEQIAEMVKRLELKKYAPHGMAAMLPGIQMMAEVLPALIREFAEEWETQVKAAFGISSMDTMLNEFAQLEPLKVKRPRGRPRKGSTLAAATAAPEPPKLINGWPVDPEERKKEMARRRAARGPRAEKERRRKISESNKARWAAAQLEKAS